MYTRPFAVPYPGARILGVAWHRSTARAVVLFCPPRALLAVFGVPPGVGGVGAVLAWLVNTAASAVIGLAVGALVVGIVSVLPFGKKKESHA